MTSTFSPRRAADSLCKALDAMSVSFERRGSGLSGSQYVTVDEYKIRFATHEARPTYEALNGAAACEIGTHSMAASADWKHALGFLCHRLGLTPPKRYAAFVSANIAERIKWDALRAYQASPQYEIDRLAAIKARMESPEFKAQLTREAAERELNSRIEAEARRLCAVEGHDFDKSKSAGRHRRNKYRALARAQVGG